MDISTNFGQNKNKIVFSIRRSFKNWCHAILYLENVLILFCGNVVLLREGEEREREKREERGGGKRERERVRGGRENGRENGREKRKDF